MNKFVAISEEFPNSPADKVKAGGLLFDRKVVRVVTPGTLIDEQFLDPWDHNFLLSIHADLSTLSDPGRSSSRVGLAYADVSSGAFYTKVIDNSALSSEVARIAPREIIIDQDLERLDSRLFSLLGDDRHKITSHTPSSTVSSNSDWAQLLRRQGIRVDSLDSSVEEIRAGSNLVDYLKTQFQGGDIRLQPPVATPSDEFMMIDKTSLRALEIKQTLRDGNLEGSLLHTVRRTVTKSGARLLSERLTSPSTSLKEINGRLDLVSELLEYPELRQDLVVLLRQTFDSWRLVQKFSFGRGDADDLISLSRTIQLTQLIAEKLEHHVNISNGPKSLSDLQNTGQNTRLSLKALLARLSLEAPSKVSQRILDAIDEEMLSERHRLEDSEAAAIAELAEKVASDAGESGMLKGIPKEIKAAKRKDNANGHDNLSLDDVWIMRRNASRTLTRLHNELDILLQEKETLAGKLRESTGAQSLTLKWTPGLGHIAHIKGRDTSASLSALNNVRSVSSSRSTRSLHIGEWTQLGTTIDEAKYRIRSEETRVFSALREEVVRNLVLLRHNASVLDELDVACSFATLAHEHQLIRPKLNNGTTHRIVCGRHLMVETGLSISGRAFASNDCTVGLSPGSHQILLITGPNMAGKSTFLRQNALISILAQTGSYVPAEYAEIGIVDKLFSRVGSADNIYQDQSTFMTEMLETATILKQATERSFVIMDEVGRGTTPEDGIAVGYACLWHLHEVNKCRALFATHFHALTDMTSNWPAIGTFCTDVVVDQQGGWSFVHKLRPGVCRRSHALKVAKLAGRSFRYIPNPHGLTGPGLPDKALDVAEEVLARLQTPVASSFPAQQQISAAAV